jgi:hypothetical protein
MNIIQAPSSVASMPVLGIYWIQSFKSFQRSLTGDSVMLKWASLRVGTMVKMRRQKKQSKSCLKINNWR